MAMGWWINGPALVQVKGNIISGIPTLSNLGLSDGPIRVSPTLKHKDINVDAWGEAAADVQNMLAEVNMQFTLVDFDPTVLESCVIESMGGPAVFGQLAKAGLPLGGNAARFAAGNHYMGLNITSPDGSRPWNFQFSYMPDTPFDWPLGTEKSITTVRWRVIPFTLDPYNSGNGAQSYPLWTRTLDT